MLYKVAVLLKICCDDYPFFVVYDECWPRPMVFGSLRIEIILAGRDGDTVVVVETIGL